MYVECVTICPVVKCLFLTGFWWRTRRVQNVHVLPLLLICVLKSNCVKICVYRLHFFKMQTIITHTFTQLFLSTQINRRVSTRTRNGHFYWPKCFGLSESVVRSQSENCNLQRSRGWHILHITVPVISKLLSQKHETYNRDYSKYSNSLTFLDVVMVDGKGL